MEITERHDNFIMATGGGTPIYHENHELMYQSGITIYLEAEVDILLERLWPERFSRPLISNTPTKEELRNIISQLLKEREPYYRLAHIYWDIQMPKEKLLEKIKIMLGC